MGSGQPVPDRGGILGTSRVSPTARTGCMAGRGIHGSIVDDIVVAADRIHTAGSVVQIQKISGLPRDIMIRTRGVATDPNRAQ